MEKIKRIVSILNKIVLGIFGIRLIDPIVIFYLKENNTFYPIISKSGCSSIKLDLIRMYNKEFSSGFPKIHQVDPSKITNKMVEQYKFNNLRSYLNFSKGKNICLIIRNPYERFYSCYLDIIKEKNIMYNQSFGLHKIFDFSFDKFLSIIYLTPDYLSDRHFRSQSFYFSQKVQKVINKSEVLLLEDFMNNKTNSLAPIIKLNSNKQVIPKKVLHKLKKQNTFKKRYKSDILLFEQVKNQR